MNEEGPMPYSQAWIEINAAKAALLTHYCEWIRWRAINGACSSDEIALADDLDAIEAGQGPKAHAHWVRDDDEARQRVTEASA